jgi:hypothetical protein
VADLKRYLKFGLLAWMIAWVIILLPGCGRNQTAADRSEVEFTVVAPDELPVELASEIEANKTGEIRMAYTDGGYMYLIRGYGEQKTGGYSISVVECTEDETAVYFDTRLLGPSNQEQLSKDPSWPYIVVKIEGREKEAVIE